MSVHPVEPDPGRATVPESSETLCPIAGIGTSAGGIGALRELFAALPDDTGLAFVVVMHLSPEHESHLVEFLRQCTRMRVRQVTRTTALEPNHVYVIPPNANLEAIDTHLRLTPLEQRRGDRAPIDHFFRTLAATHDGSAVGVVLTGTGSDGALGLRRIRERGGLTIAQDPAEAEHESMPRHAIATGMVDVVAPLKDIAKEIVRFSATHPRLPVPDANDAIAPAEQRILEEIVAQLKLHTGQELGVYKRGALLERIRRRMRIRHVETLADYLDVLRQVPREPHALLEDHLSHVVEVFGDREAFARLQEHVVPRLFAGKADEHDRVRVWSIGCVTGEEAYSLALLLVEEAERRHVSPRLQVLASGLSDAMLDRARAGRYPAEVAASLAPDRIARFFEREGSHYRLRHEVRDLVVFAKHDVLDDPPFSHLDLVVCRNFLCDLQPTARRSAAEIFSYALEPKGLLLLGTGESVDAEDLFAPEDEEASLYVKRATAEPSTFRRSAKGRAVRRARSRPPWPPPRAPWGAERAARREASGGALLQQRQPLRAPSWRGAHRPDPPARPRAPALGATHRLRERLADGAPWRSAALTVETDSGPRRVALRLVPDDDSRYSRETRPLLLVFEELEPQPLPGGVGLSAARHSVVLADVSDGLEETRARLLEPAGREDRSAQDEKEALQEVNDTLQGANDALLRREHGPAGQERCAARGDGRLADLPGRARGHQRGAPDRRRGEPAPPGTSPEAVERPAEPARSHGCRHAVPRQASVPRALHPAGDRHLPSAACRPRAAARRPPGQPALSGARRGRGARAREPRARRARGAGRRRALVPRAAPPYRAAANQVAGLVLSFLDITDRKRAEEELRAADRRKDEFLATLGHELRNPLAPIVSGIAAMRASLQDPHMAEEILLTMERQTKQLVRLVDDLLEVSRISGGQLRLRLTRVDLADVVRDAVAAVRPLIDAARHELAVTLPSERIALEVDANRLVQVVGNLLSNAARYTPRGGHIALTVRREGDEAVIAVKDDGIGIPAPMLGKIFELFAQLDQTNQTPTSGLGLGLTLARSLVGDARGHARRGERRARAGAEFTVRLPIPAALSETGATRGAG
jgi:two-component system CheB/CheR fusion protein